jgi:hypothetical protein
MQEEFASGGGTGFSTRRINKLFVQAVSFSRFGAQSPVQLDTSL